jgi:RNA polymerase sigma-70 factor, ECF subfamily
VLSRTAAGVAAMCRVIRGGRNDRDAENQAWLEALRSRGAERELAVARLHEVLVRAARFELVRRRRMLGVLRGESLEDLATQSADDALAALLAKLDDFRSESRFTTWAAKFAILEAAVRARRRLWHDRELPVDPVDAASVWDRTTDPDATVQTRALLGRISDAIRTELSPHQREVLTAVVLAGVPIDVLAERLNTTRGALYKTLHDARQKLRRAIEMPYDEP